MRLSARTVGPQDGAPVTFLHGFTQTGDSWSPVLELLGGVRATLIDAPGHGENAAHELDLRDTAVALAATMPRGVLVGYSMGARMALHVALAAPAAVTALVLVSGTAGIEDDDERAARRAADESLADRIEEIGTARFVDEWLANPMFAGLPEVHARRPARAANPAAGLAGSLRTAGTGTQENLWPRLGEVTCPVLVVTGKLDAKFAAIGERMAASFPRGELSCIDGAGHTVHLERVEEFCRVLSDWLARVP